MKILIFLLGTLFGMSFTAATAVILVENGTVLEYVLKNTEVTDVNFPTYFMRYNSALFPGSWCWYGDVSRWRELPRLYKWRPLNDYVYFTYQKFGRVPLTTTERDLCNPFKS